MTTQLATRTAGHMWAGEDLSTELFLRNGTGSAWAETTREPLPEMPAPGIWHTLMTFAKYGKPDLDALRQCVVEVLNDTGPGSIQVLLDLLCVPTNFELSVQIGSMSGASQTQVGTSGSGSAQLELRGEAAAEEPPHARLAREIREMTDLPAGSLAAALGVTREQYQRWLKSSPISKHSTRAADLSAHDCCRPVPARRR